MGCSIRVVFELSLGSPRLQAGLGAGSIRAAEYVAHKKLHPRNRYDKKYGKELGSKITFKDIFYGWFVNTDIQLIKDSKDAQH